MSAIVAAVDSTVFVAVHATECSTYAQCAAVSDSFRAIIYATVEESIESADDTAFCAAHIGSKCSAVVTAFWLSYRAAIA